MGQANFKFESVEWYLLNALLTFAPFNAAFWTQNYLNFAHFHQIYRTLSLWTPDY